MISFEEAVARTAAAATPLPAETVPLAQAHGRVLAEPIIARVNAPPADVSAMDGYAVRTADLATLPAALAVIGQSLPGRGFAEPVRPDTAVRIFTGAPVPTGADSIVIQEHVCRAGEQAIVERVEDATYIRSRGLDFSAGDTLVQAGTRIGPRTLVAAAGADLAEVRVHRRPCLFLLATGDELAEPGRARDRPGAIPDSVSLGVMALASEWGAEPVGIKTLPDQLDQLRQGAAEASAVADLVVVTGGASVGERDFARAMFGDTLNLHFAKVAIKPGKPVWLGQVGDTLVMGLPGNPTSALVTARLLLAPLLARLTGRDPDEALRWRHLPLGEALGPTGDRETFSRAYMRDGAVHLLPNQDSGAQRTLAQAEMLVRRSIGADSYAVGELLPVLDL